MEGKSVRDERSCSAEYIRKSLTEQKAERKVSQNAAGAIIWRVLCDTKT